MQVWKESSSKFKVTDVTAERNGEAVRLKVTYLLAAGNDYTAEYTVWPSGAVEAAMHFASTDRKAVEVGPTEAQLEATFSPAAAEARKNAAELEVPRIGMRFRLPVSMNGVEYYGRGPQENYCDRKAGTLAGIYRTTADQMYYPYVRPQENGHHTDTRRVTFGSGKGSPVLDIYADGLMEFNALRNSVEDFDSEECKSRPYQWRNLNPGSMVHNEAAAANSIPRRTHIDDIVPRDYVEVCLDMLHQGVAGYDSWGSRPEPEFRISAGREYRWGFTMIPR